MPDILLDRRSVRRYKTDAIPAAVLDEIIRTAMFAPSANNRQPWHFLLVDDRPALNRIMELHPYASMLRQAPAAVVVCGDLDISADYWMVDCSAATMNLLLAAKARGIGSCWCGIYPREERMNAFSEAFSIPDGIRPFALVALGYADEEKPRPDRFKPDRVHHNHW